MADAKLTHSDLIRNPIKHKPTGKELRQLFRYDDETGRLYWRERTGHSREVQIFNTQFAGKEAGWIFKPIRGTDPYRQVCIRHNNKNVHYRAHHIIWAMHHDRWPRIVDHDNGDTLDNKIGNLREATQGQNNANAKRHKNNTSGYKGVFYNKWNKTWCASTGIDGKCIRKNFKTIEEAIEFRKKIAKKMHGDFYREE